MVKISQRDFPQYCVGALFWHKATLILVKGMEDGEVVCYDIRTGKPYRIKFDQHTEFTPVNERIGMVNFMKSVVFITRRTIRQFLISTAKSNVEISCIGRSYYPLGMEVTHSKACYLSNVELIAALKNDYPPLPEAYIKASEWKGACAFDKQFAITYDKKIFYKEKLVGTYDDAHNVINFSVGFEFLDSLLENGYEKDSRTFKPTPIRR